MIIAVRTDNGPNLPVKYLGREIGRTDASGAFTYMLSGKPGDHMEFTLDTSEKANDNLRPQNPTMSLVVDNKDNYYPLDQPFQIQRAKVVYAQRAPTSADRAYSASILIVVPKRENQR